MERWKRIISLSFLLCSGVLARCAQTSGEWSGGEARGKRLSFSGYACLLCGWYSSYVVVLCIGFIVFGLLFGYEKILLHQPIQSTRPFPFPWLEHRDFCYTLLIPIRSSPQHTRTLLDSSMQNIVRYDLTTTTTFITPCEVFYPLVQPAVVGQRKKASD